MAMQQGGLGLLMTFFFVTVPPMAAAFFQGTLGHFSAYTQFGVAGANSGGNRAATDGSGRPVVVPQAPAPVTSVGGAPNVTANRPTYG